MFKFKYIKQEFTFFYQAGFKYNLLKSTTKQGQCKK